MQIRNCASGKCDGRWIGGGGQTLLRSILKNSFRYFYERQQPLLLLLLLICALFFLSSNDGSVASSFVQVALYISKEVLRSFNEPTGRNSIVEDNNRQVFRTVNNTLDNSARSSIILLNRSLFLFFLHNNRD